jgi:diadenosine tetraphosphate (Ap4A) HIT family hydrolase
VQVNSIDCYTCLSISGEKRISPGPTIYAGEYWLVEHAYPCGIVGWLVLVLKRHAEALHELSNEEFSEFAELQHKTAKLLHSELNSAKEYTVCFAEAEHFNHVHFHIISRSSNLPVELRGTGIFSMLKVTEDEAVSRAEIRTFCERLKDVFATEYQ